MTSARWEIPLADLYRERDELVSLRSAGCAGTRDCRHLSEIEELIAARPVVITKDGLYLCRHCGISTVHIEATMFARGHTFTADGWDVNSLERLDEEADIVCDNPACNLREPFGDWQPAAQRAEEGASI